MTLQTQESGQGLVKDAATSLQGDTQGEGSEGRGGILSSFLVSRNPLEPSPTTTTTHSPLLDDSSDLSDLGWIIPVAIVCIVAMVGIAFAFYYGIRKLEMRMLNWCIRNCACCCPGGGGEEERLLGGERYASLNASHKTERDRKASLKMRS
jgi:hypothetical protein